MNRIRRKELAEARELIEQAMQIIESCKDEEQDAYDNLPEGIQQSSRGERMDECIYLMDDALLNADSILDSLNDIID